MNGIELFQILLLLAFLKVADAAQSLPPRHLKATKNTNPLAHRSIGLHPSFSDNHLYYSEYQEGVASYLSGKVTLEPHLPTVLIDDVSEHYHRIECEDDRVYIYFSDLGQLEHAEQAWSGHESFMIVTSQPGCAVDGDHQAYKISDHKFLRDSRVATLSSKKDSMKACNKRMHVSVETIEAPIIPTKSYNKRQLSSIPVPLPSTPTASPTATSAAADIGWHYEGIVFPPEGAVGDALKALTQFPDHMEFSCVTCETAGVMELTAANFSTAGNTFEEVHDILENGQLFFTAKGVRANFSLELSFLPGFQASVFTANVPSIPIVGFKLGTYIDLAAQVDLTFPFNIELNSPVNMTSGFSLKVPDDSRIIVDIDHFNTSTITGFQRTEFTPQPFNMDAPDLSFSFLAGFQPQINLVASAGEEDRLSLDGHIGVFLDMPMLNTTIASVQHVSSTCDPMPEGGLGLDSFDAINIMPVLVFDGGVRGGLSAKVLNETIASPGGGDEEVVLIAAPPIPLETSCLKYDSKSSSLVEADPANQPDTGEKNAAGTLRSNISSMAFFTSLILLASLC